MLKKKKEVHTAFIVWTELCEGAFYYLNWGAILTKPSEALRSEAGDDRD